MNIKMKLFYIVTLILCISIFAIKTFDNNYHNPSHDSKMIFTDEINEIYRHDKNWFNFKDGKAELYFEDFLPEVVLVGGELKISVHHVYDKDFNSCLGKVIVYEDGSVDLSQMCEMI